MKKIYIVLFGILFLTTNLLSQAPNWTLNSNSFENSMTVVAVILVDGVELTSTNNLVGAFVGTELRGVGSTSFVNSENRYVATMLVRSNVGAGEMITFKMYDSEKDAVFEAVNSFEFLNDGIEGNTSVPIIVKDNNEPTNIELSANTVDENLAVATVIGQFSSVDIDLGDTFTYTLVVGEGDQNNTAFTIENNNLKTAQSLNYESNDTYSIRVQTTDTRNGIFSSQFTVSIGDVNDEPTDILISDNAIDENAEIGSLLSDLSTTDEDINDAFTYSLMAGDGSEDNASFTIEGAKLKTNASINFEAKNSYSIRIQTEDSGQEIFSKAFVIAINDLNDSPTEISLTTTTFNENQEIGSLIADLITSDEDPSDVHLYSFHNIGSNDNEDFAIIDNQLFTKSTFDFEERITYFIDLQSNDQNGGIVEQQITLNVIDQNDAPNDLKLSNTTIEENKPLGTIVGILETADQDVDETFLYSLVAGIGSDDNTSFQVVGNELQSRTIFDFESKQTYTVRLETKDSGEITIEKAFSIQIIDQNDAPTDIILDNSTVPENLSLGILIGELTSLDEDPTDSHFYSFASGADDDNNDLFSISGNKLLTKSTFDYETLNTYFVRLETNDKRGGTFQKSFIINIIDTNDDPTLLKLSVQEFDENLDVGSLVGIFSIVDVDPVAPEYFMIPGSNDNDRFLIEGDQLRSVEVFDFEFDNQYFIDVRANDGADGIIVNRFGITIKDANDTPEIIEMSSNKILENQTIESVVGMLTTTDQDVSDEFIYSLSNGMWDNTFFKISGSQIQTNEVFNFEIKNTYKISITSTDIAGASVENSFTIEINNANDSPKDILIGSVEVSEEHPIGTIVGELSSIDEDIDDTFTYTLVSGNGDSGNSDFTIDGKLLKSQSVFDAETQTAYSVRIESTDSDGEPVSKIFSITVLPVNEQPEIVEQEFSVEEKTALGTVVATVQASDVDGDLLSFSIIDTNVPFEINPASGEISTSGMELDY
ncbi:MAG: hypothetical protein ACJA2S_002773, partial [Cyclobacteriaceae bacterium]